jgi:lipoprotein-releasing system ATP-binding protein
MMDKVLEARHIDKYFKKPVLFQVLKDINLSVDKGEFVTIMGKSGCGKSTLLYILSTMDTDYDGQVLLNDEIISGQTPNHLAYLRNKHIGFVFQFHYLLAEFSVLENVMLPAKKLAEKSVMEIEKEARQKLGVLGIEHLASKKASMISGGEKQRVAIARALINNPSILMGDEPTGNLDSHNSDNVLSIFKQLREAFNLSLLIVTHDKDFADRSDRIIMMEDGRIIS